MLVQMFPAALELITNEPDAVQINPHRKLLIFFLHFPVTGAFLRQCLMVERQGQYDISADFPGMERAVEPPELHRMVAVEEAVQIEKVIAAVMVMAAAAARVILIPDRLNLRESFWFDLVHPFHKVCVHFLTVAHPFRGNL